MKKLLAIFAITLCLVAQVRIPGPGGGAVSGSPPEPNLHLRIDTLTSDGTWTAPSGVTSVQVELWGAAGGGTTNTAAGGGGAYSRCDDVVVVPTTGYPVVVGTSVANTNGEDSTFDATACVAKGGLSGSNGGTGGAAGAGTGDAKFSGGNGSVGTGNRNGGGGAGTAANGSNGTGGAQGSGGSFFGGRGLSSDNRTGTQNGGGGSSNATDQFAGSNGLARITYLVEVEQGAPIVISRNWGHTTSASTSHSISMPAGFEAGDLLLAVIGSQEETYTIPADWKRACESGTPSTSAHGLAVYKIAEGGDSLVLTTGTTADSTHITMAVRGAAEPTCTIASGQSVNADPPSHSLVVDSGEFLWVTVLFARAINAVGDGIFTVSPPTGYDDFLHLSYSLASNMMATSLAASHTSAGTEDPLAWTNPGNPSAWAVATIGISATQQSLAASGSYSWWVYPLAVTIDSRTYLSNVGPVAQQNAIEVDADGKYVGITQLDDEYSKDEHNAAAVIELSDGGVLWAWAGHNDESFINYYKSADGSLPSGSFSRTQLATGGDATYAQLLTRASEVFWFYRISNTAWSSRYSNDDADTWSSERAFLGDAASEQMYILARKSDVDTMRVLVTNNGGTASNHFWVANVDLTDGDVSTGSGSLGNLDGTSLPAARSELSSIYDASAGRGLRLLDIKDDASAFVYADYDLDDSPQECTYRLARFTGANQFASGDWTHSDIGPCGTAFYTASHYFGGVFFANESHSGLRIYLSREDSGTWYIERCDSALGDGSDFSCTELDSDGSNLLLRPTSPVGAASGFPVYWQKAASWTLYNDFQVDVVTP